MFVIFTKTVYDSFFTCLCVFLDNVFHLAQAQLRASVFLALEEQDAVQVICWTFWQN